MKSLFYWRILITICGVLLLSCQKETISKEVSPTAQGSEITGAAAQKAGVFRDNFHLPVEFTAFSQCAGEELHFVGEFHWNSVTVIDANGGFHSVFVANDHNLAGVGLTTGIKYHEVGATTDVFNVTGSGALEGTVTITLNYIGQGPGNNAINKANFHYTFNANGTLTVIFENATQILCQ